MKKLLEMKDVSLALDGRQILKNVNLHVRAGEIKGVIGPNAAGKTMLVKIAGTVIRTGVTGAMMMDYQNVLELSSYRLRRHRLRIGQQPQQTPIDPDTSINDQLALMALVRGVRPRNIEREVERTLSLFGLTERASRTGREQNGGSKVRLSLALASIGLPRESLILSDEPTAPLSPPSAKEIGDCLMNLCDDFGHGILVVTHDLRWLRGITNSAFLVKNGCVQERVLAVVPGQREARVNAVCDVRGIGVNANVGQSNDFKIHPTDQAFAAGWHESNYIADPRRLSLALDNE